ncbi:arylesterase [Gammaproteobacteria bacterium]|nr:arylesterase [Gammaproteobacteria bacterium]
MFLTSKIEFFTRYLILLLGILLLVASPVHSSNQSTKEKYITVVLGDSLSAGYGVKIEESWPSVLESNLNASGMNIAIVNAGISGDTTSGGLFRLPKLLKEHKPDLVILELGGNDGLRGMSVKKVIRKNLEAMIKMSLIDRADVLLIGVELPPNYGEQYTNNFKDMYAELAIEYNLPLVNGSIKEMVSLNLMQADGIHPNIKGHLKIEEEIRNAILTLLD